MTQVNLKYVRGSPILCADWLREEGQYCVELHNYYIQNYKMCDNLMVQYKEHHFLVSDDIFVISFYDLYDLFTLATLDSHALLCIVSKNQPL
jgi:hypothetical protein